MPVPQSEIYGKCPRGHVTAMAYKKDGNWYCEDCDSELTYQSATYYGGKGGNYK